MFDQIQSRLLEQVKQQVDPRFSYVDELAELLDLSKDSVYRRIRGETELSLRESLRICEKYGLSLHELAGNQSNLYTFRGRLVGDQWLNIYQWLQAIHENLTMLESFTGTRQLTYYTKDLPVFYYFNRPGLSTFKVYFWMCTIHNYPEYQTAQFSPGDVPQEMIRLGERIWEKYCRIPCLEIWSQETILVTLKQIEYYHDCGYFKEPENALVLLEDFEKLMEDANRWMTNGQKPDGASLMIYRNDILIGDNTILFTYGDDKLVFLPIGNLSIISTGNSVFTEHISGFLDTVIRRSVLISSTGEKERNRFFSFISHNIASLKQRLTR